MVSRSLAISFPPSSAVRPVYQCEQWWLLDVTLGDVLVVFLAGVLHHLPVRSEREGSGVLPRLRKRLRVVDGHLVGDVLVVGELEAFHYVQRVTVWVTDGIQIGLVVEPRGIDNKRVSFPLADRMSDPGRLPILGMRTAVRINNLEDI